MSQTPTLPVADALVCRLLDHGARHIFGYPGGQLTPVYDALYRTSAIRHYLARHEQAAAFMADGFARATGQVGVCLAVCGPGVLNAATPLLAAYTDSVPLLLISGQTPRAHHGPRCGAYHENDQRLALASFTKAQLRVEEPGAIVDAVDRAWATARSGRPGPVLLEIPVYLLRTSHNFAPWPAVPLAPAPAAPPAGSIPQLAKLLAGWRRPLLLAGGGVLRADAGPQLVRVAERLGAPVLHTANGKGAMPASHALAAGMPWLRATSDLTEMQDHFSPLFAQADGVLAIGCRFTQLTTGSWQLRLPPLAQIDVDAAELGRHYPVQQGIVADAAIALQELCDELPLPARPPWTSPRPSREPWRLPGIDLLATMRRLLPADAIVAADITRLAYLLMAEFPIDQPRCFLHPAGAVAMGYGLPAALGARAAFPNRVVVAVAGDGGFQMSGLELATAVQERLPVVVILINDNRLTLIQATQQRRYEKRYIAVDLHNPDFARFAAAFDVRYWRADDDATFERALQEALSCGTTALIEVRPSDANR